MGHTGPDNRKGRKHATPTLPHRATSRLYRTLPSVATPIDIAAARIYESRSVGDCGPGL